MKHNTVKKFMDRFNKPKTFKDKTKYKREQNRGDNYGNWNTN